MPFTNFRAQRGALRLFFAASAALAASFANAQQVSSLTLTPAGLTGGSSSAGLVTLNGPAPAGGFIVTLVSGNGAAVVQPNVTVPSGALTAPFTVTTTPVPSNVAATIFASGGGKTVVATLGIKAPKLKTLMLNPTSVVGSLNSAGKVALNGVAPAGGISVTLSSDSSFASVGGPVHIADGATNAFFTVKTTSVAAPSVATISGTAGGLTVSATLDVLPPTAKSVTLHPASVAAGGSTVGTVVLDVPAPAGGISVPVAASSTDINVFTANVPGGSKSGTFGISAIANAAPAIHLITVGTAPKSASTSLHVVTDPWPQYRGDSRNTGRGAGTGGTGAFKWLSQQFGEIGATPAIGRDGTIYFGTTDANLYAVAPSGKVKWKLPLPDWIQSSVAIAPNGTLYVGCYDGNLYAVDPNGNYLWHYPTFSPITSSPTVGPDGTIYFGSINSVIYALNPDGTIKWGRGTGHFVTSSAAVAADGTIYISSWDHFLYALYPDGAVKWKYNTNGTNDVAPAIGEDGTIYIGSGYQGLNEFYAINPDGTTKWTFAAAANVQSPAAISPDGTVYVGSNNGDFFAINPDGTKKWKYQLSTYVFAGATIATNGNIHVGDSNGLLVCLTPAGTLKWSYNMGGFINGGAALGLDGSVYVACGDGKIYKFR